MRHFADHSIYTDKNTKTCGDVVRNIVFEDNDVIYAVRGMVIYLREGALVENIQIGGRPRHNLEDARIRVNDYVDYVFRKSNHSQ